MFQAYAWSTFSVRPDGALAEATAAVRTYVMQHVYHAMTAKSAFVGANMSLRRIWWQVFVAVLAVWS